MQLIVDNNVFVAYFTLGLTQVSKDAYPPYNMWFAYFFTDISATWPGSGCYYISGFDIFTNSYVVSQGSNIVCNVTNA